jgi:hypothetical protein
MKTINTTPQIDKKKQSTVGFKVALNILERWGCSNEQMMAIVQLGRATFFKYKKNPEAVNLSSDQLDRVSYVLNIHSVLRLIFSNPDNVYGFVNKKNSNPYFNGKTPLELMSTGKFGILHDVYRNIDTMRGGQW